MNVVESIFILDGKSYYVRGMDSPAVNLMVKNIAIKDEMFIKNMGALQVVMVGYISLREISNSGKREFQKEIYCRRLEV